MYLEIEKSLPYALDDANILCAIEGSIKLLTIQEFKDKITHQ